MNIIFTILLPPYNTLKGDDNIKNVTIKFLGTGYNSYYQAYVCIYDETGNLVFEGETYNGVLCLDLCLNQVYTIKATCLNDRLTGVIYVNCYTNKYVLAFNRCSIENTTAEQSSFILTDYYYDNLPIERGQINLWKM